MAPLLFRNASINMCLVIMAFVNGTLYMYGYTQHKQYDVRLIFGNPCLPSVPHSAGLCPAVSRRASFFQYLLWLTNCFVMYL